MRMRSRLAMLVFGLAACSRSGPPAGPSAQLSVGGAYTLTKTVLEDTCGGPLASFTFAARVSHTPGAADFVLNDTFNDLPGTVSLDGVFAIAARRTGTHQGAAVISAFDQGRFTRTEMEVRVRLDIDGPSGSPPFAACRVLEAWRGVKQGLPNVIP